MPWLLALTLWFIISDVISENSIKSLTEQISYIRSKDESYLQKLWNKTTSDEFIKMDKEIKESRRHEDVLHQLITTLAYETDVLTEEVLEDK